MSFMFEIYYKPPVDPKKESALTSQISKVGGRLSYRENPEENGKGSVCLTYEFENLDQALEAAKGLQEQGEHVEGPVDYGT